VNANCHCEMFPSGIFHSGIWPRNPLAHEEALKKLESRSQYSPSLSYSSSLSASSSTPSSSVSASLSHDEVDSLMTLAAVSSVGDKEMESALTLSEINALPSSTSSTSSASATSSSCEPTWDEVFKDSGITPTQALSLLKNVARFTSPSSTETASSKVVEFPVFPSPLQKKDEFLDGGTLWTQERIIDGLKKKKEEKEQEEAAKKQRKEAREARRKEKEKEEAAKQQRKAERAKKKEEKEKEKAASSKKGVKRKERDNEQDNDIKTSPLIKRARSNAGQMALLPLPAPQANMKIRFKKNQLIK
jgi:hypothetical protein